MSLYLLQNLDSHTKDVITNNAYHEINNNTKNINNIKDVTTDIYDTQHGNRIQGRKYSFNNHYNGGHEDFGLQNLGGFDISGIAKAIGGGAKAGGEIWKAVDPNSYNKQGKGIMGGIAGGAGAVGDISKDLGFVNLDQEYELQSLFGFSDVAKAVGGGAKAGGEIWKAVDPNSYNKQGKGIMGGIAGGAGAVGDISKDMGFVNLDQDYELQSLFGFSDVAKAVGGGAKAGGEIWKAVDPNSYNKQGKGIMGGIAGGAGAVGDISKDMGFVNLDQQYEL